MNLRPANATVCKTNHRHTLQFAPAALPVLPTEAHNVADLPTDRNCLNIVNSVDDVKMHAPCLPADFLTSIPPDRRLRTSLRVAVDLTGHPSLSLWIFWLFTLALAGSLHAATFIVNNTIDRVPTNAADRVEGSLRQAILDANANPGPDTIIFQLGAGARIAYTNTAPMPAITDPVTLNGFNPDGSRTELDGAGADINNPAGFAINAGSSTVRGFVINRFGTGILLRTNGFNRIEGNFIGTDASGTIARPNRDHGINIINSASNVIGGFTAEARNLLSGNTSTGILINRRESVGNEIVGNFIGTDVTGTLALPNGEGVGLFSAVSNRVGGVKAGARNIISGNNVYGVDLSNQDALGNVIQGNYIGTDVSGLKPLPNTRHGIFSFRAAGSLIGGTEKGAGNLISGNLLDGIVISQPAFAGSAIQGNFIGVDAGGGKALPNGEDGIILSASYSNLVGGGDPGAGNVISGNGEDGITIVGAVSTNNAIQGNLIGTDATGHLAVGNAFDGVTFELGASDNLLGGSGGLLSGNVISGNLKDGVSLTDPATKRNLIQGNFIGADASGARNLGNGEDGVFLSTGTSGNLIGGTNNSSGNVIAFNGQHGIFAPAAGTNNGILGNSISANALLGIDLGSDGVTPNDPGDPDAGPNNLQNFPVLTSAQREASRLTVQGSLQSLPNQRFRIEFFLNDTCPASEKGEGTRFLGSAAVTTDAAGQAAINVVFTTFNQKGDGVTAMATDPSNNSSEFSACLPVAGSQTVDLGFNQVGNQLVLIWPAAFSGYILESTDNLEPPNWQPVPGNPQIVDGQNKVTLPIENGNRFFRLRKP